MRYAYNSGYYHDVYSAMMSAMVVIYMVIALVNLVIYVLSIIADYRLFEKAGEEGWKAIIPFYNYFVLCRIVMGDSLWFWLGFVPGINVFGRLYIRFKTGEAYGKTTGCCCRIYSGLFWRLTQRLSITDRTTCAGQTAATSIIREIPTTGIMQEAGTRIMRTTNKIRMRP